MRKILEKLVIPADVKEMLLSGKGIVVPGSREQLIDLTYEGAVNGEVEVAYDSGEKCRVVEARVMKAKNGAVVNYPEAYMRRRDPNCMAIADDKPTDKPKFREKYGYDFSELRTETLNWLGERELIVMPFTAGSAIEASLSYPALLIVPKNAGFFAAALADLQGFIPAEEIPVGFTPQAILFIAPPFRHTHFNGKQVVVHNRLDKMHEIFAYNLYPGPSAKKGIYSMLLNIGEREGWTTIHASTVEVITPYDNVVTVLHEGASGGGKSEMLEAIHREPDGRVKLATNSITQEAFYLELNDTCELHPITDDMALCHSSLQDDSGKLVIQDAEAGWFWRVDHITQYGTAPLTERLTIHPKGPLIFLNMMGQPNATCLIWEHTMDTETKRCPNPRVVMPRDYVPDVVKRSARVDIRSFGVRVPVCTKENPSYGIMGFLHLLPPALAWLWRLVAPRGHGNPSILDTDGMHSEGVGSYWPFATGRKVDQANLLLTQIQNTPNTRYVLIPNQHVGAYKVGFMTEWLDREYLARKGNFNFKEHQISPARCTLLGYCLESIKVDGSQLPKSLLKTHLQPEVGIEGYDAGAKILEDFFREEVQKFLHPDLLPLGRQIIEAYLNGASVDELSALL